jgi:AcrR family transcriptional regulator
VERIYRAFGSKAALFKAVVEAAVAGGAARAEIPPDGRPAIQAVVAETNPRRQLECCAATQPGIHARMGPLLRVLAEAAAADPELGETARQSEGERLAGVGRFAQLLADRGALRPGLDVDQARDVLWTLNSHAIHELLVVQRGWSPERYRDWLADALARVLLRDREVDPTEPIRRGR